MRYAVLLPRYNDVSGTSNGMLCCPLLLLLVSSPRGAWKPFVHLTPFMVLKLEQLENRWVLSAPTYHGGLVMQNPAVSTVFVGGYSQKFDEAISLATGIFTQNLGAFGVQSATRNGTITTGSPGILQNTTDIGNLLDSLIASNQIPQPLSPNQMYILVLGNQTIVPSVPNGGAFHSEAFYDGTPIVYVVVFSTGPNAGTYGVFHDYAEAATDPLFNGWYGDDPSTQEIADLANGFDYDLRGLDAAAVVGSNGQLITSPTNFVPVTGLTTNPSNSTTSPTFPILFSNFNLGTNFFTIWQQGIDSLVSFWESWESNLLGIEARLWNALSSWQGEL